MDRDSKSVGGKIALIFAAGYVPLLLILAIFASRAEIVNFPVMSNKHNLIVFFVGAGTFFLTAYLQGRRSGFDILIKMRNPAVKGVQFSLICLFVSLATSNIAAMGYDYFWHWKTGFSEVWHLSTSLEKYFLKFFSFGILSLIPFSISGMIFGHFTKNRLPL